VQGRGGVRLAGLLMVCIYIKCLLKNYSAKGLATADALTSIVFSDVVASSPIEVILSGILMLLRLLQLKNGNSLVGIGWLYPNQGHAFANRNTIQIRAFAEYKISN
jgi:hypothetical protein